MTFQKESERVRARARLDAQTPAPPDESRLRAAEQEAASILREAESSSASPKQTASSVIKGVSQSYDQYLEERRSRRPRPSKAPR
jgi:hypothetical protein